MNKTLDTLSVIAIVGLDIAAIILILIEIFSETESGWMLTVGLLCSVLGNLGSLIRMQLLKRDAKK